jgi:carboxyl-terminal processing protease
VRKLRGAKGTAVTLTIWRESFEKPKTYTIIRDIIQIHSVKGRMLEPGYGYVRVSQFQEKTGVDLRGQLEALRTDQAAPFKGLILDLRNNPGGLLDQAVSVSDLFIDEGLIVYTEGRESGSQMRFTATAEGTEPAYPMVVLINGGSASASEIVAGALGDHGRAVILGERSFGKGSVQTIVPLSDDSGLRLTTARYFTPNGISIQAKGIVPDIVVSALKLPPEAGVSQVRERDLEHHIERPPVEEEPGREEEGATLSDDDRLDFQLMRALDLLKGLEIMKTKTPSAA